MKLKSITTLLPLCANIVFPLSVVNQTTDNIIYQPLNTSKSSSNQDSSLQFDQWTNAIVDSSNNNNIKLFVTRDVSLVYQQALIATNYMLIANKNNPSAITNKLYWLINEKDYNSQKWNFDYYRNNYNYLNVIDNISDLNYSVNSPFDNWLDNNMIQALVDYFENINPNGFKIDLWISDINIEKLWNGSNDLPNSYEFYLLLKHIDKINILSDGNYQSKYFAVNFVDRINLLKKQYSQTEVNQKLKAFRNDTNNVLFNEFKTTSIFDFLLDNTFFNVFNVASYYNSPFYHLSNQYSFYPVYLYQYDYYSMGQLLFDTTKQQEQFNNFIYLYESFFNWTNINSFTDLIAENSHLYDPKKKNVFYIGDSLITDESEFYTERKIELNKITEAMLRKYNPNEYNWIFKNHPRYTIEVQKYLNSFMFGRDFNPIYLKNFPWEMFLSWDNKKQQQDKNYQSFFSKSTDLTNNVKTVLVGLQYSSTVIETTWFYLKNVYQLDDLTAYLSVDAKNFPIGVTYNIIKPTKAYNYNWKQNYLENYDIVVGIHEPFYQLQNFYDYKKDLLDSKSFINSQDIDYDYPSEFNPINLIIIIVSVVLFLSIIILLVVLIIKRYRKKDTSRR